MIKIIKNIVDHRELITALTISGIKAKYKQSILGVGWAIFQPLALMIISLFIFSYLAKVPSDNIPYPIFSYAALVPWVLFSTALSYAIPSLVTNINLLRKIYFPREVFILSAVLTSLFDYFIAFIIFLGMLMYYDITLGINIIFFPLILLIQILLMVGVSLMGSIINVAFRDVANALPVILQIWMLGSPIVYPLSLVPDKYKNFYMLNPMAGIIDSYRNIFLENTAPNFYYLFIAAVVSLIIFILGYSIFKKGEEIIADII